MDRTFLILWIAVVTMTPATAHTDETVRADAHAPIGVMGDHFHSAGEWMFSYRYMSMEMDDSLFGSDSIDADTIVTTIPNRFAGMPGMPPTLRIVPLDMSMDMHMFGLMWAPFDRLTLMLMANYLEQSMNHVTYMGPTGTTVLGNFATSTSGWSDTTVTGLIPIIAESSSRLHLIAGLSVPTGSTDEIGEALTPMNARVTLRLPYPMQLGSGSLDPILGASYSGFGDRWSWGAQWRSIFRVDDNDEGYRLGDAHGLTGWMSYLLSPPVSASLRLQYYRRDRITGIDPVIMGPVQTADPDRQGGERIDAGLGVNLAGEGGLQGWRLGIEYLVPLSQDLNGPQLETHSQLIIGLQYTFD